MADKKHVSFARIVFTGLFWTPAYVYLAAWLCQQVYGFNPLLQHHWQDLFEKFISGRWVVDSWLDFVFLMSILLLVPLWIFGWIKLNHTKWGKFIPKCLKEHRIQHKILNQSTLKKTFIPQKMRVQTSAVFGVNAVQAAATTMGNTASSSSSVSAMPSLPQPVYPDDNDIQSIMPFIQNIPADFFPHILLNERYASFALSNSNKAIVVTLINYPTQNWSVDTESDVQKSDWYSETEIWPAPLAPVVQIASDLRESDPDAAATAVAVLMSGHIINADKSVDYFENQGVILTRLESVDEPDIPLFSDFLAFYFNSSDTENDISELNEFNQETSLETQEEPYGDSSLPYLDDDNSVPEPEEV